MGRNITVIISPGSGKLKPNMTRKMCSTSYRVFLRLVFVITAITIVSQSLHIVICLPEKLNSKIYLEKCPAIDGSNFQEVNGIADPKPHSEGRAI